MNKKKRLYQKPKMETHGDLKNITKKIEGPPDGYNDFGTS